MKKWCLLCLGLCFLMAIQSCSIPISTKPKMEKTNPKVVFKWDALPADQSPLFYTWSEKYMLKGIEEGILEINEVENAARNVTRGEFLHWLVKTMRIKGNRKPIPFRDIPEDHSLYASVKAAFTSGILAPADIFEPDQPLIRSEASLWLVRSLGEETIEKAEQYSEPYIPAQDGFYEIPKEAVGAMTVCCLPTHQLLYYRWYKNNEYRYIAPNQPMMVFEAAYSLMMLKHPPVKGGSLVVGQKEEPKTLFSGIDHSVEINRPLEFIEMPLIQGRDENWCFFPVLIKQVPTLENGLWKISEQNGKKRMVIKYELHHGLKWSDGTDMTAQDIVFGSYLYLHPEFPSFHSKEETWIEKIEAPDPETVIVTWNHFLLNANRWLFRAMPEHFFQKELQQTLQPYSLTDPTYYDASKDKADTQENESYLSPRYLSDRAFIDSVVRSSFNSEPVYAGPYKLKEWQKGNTLLLEQNEYFVYGPPLIEEITFLTIKDSAEFSHGSEVLFAAVLAGKVDVTLKDLTLEQALTLKSRNINHRSYFPPSMTWEHLILNTDDPILAQKKVREALLYGIDRKAIMLDIFTGQVSPANTWYPPLHPVTRNGAWVEFDYNPEKARNNFKEAGWNVDKDGWLSKNGKILSMTLITTKDNPLREKVQNAIADYWKQLGIQVTVQNEEKDFLFNRLLQNRLFSGPTAVMISIEQNPDYNSSICLHSQSIPSEQNHWTGMNYSAYHNPEVDAWLEASEQPNTKAEYYQYLLKIQITLIEELPCLPLYFYPLVSSAHEDLENFRPSGTSSLTVWNVANWYWKTLKK
ncbi:MAG: ABC transporter substrate-binding protein [Caldisericia bacterium]|nr:ABC transporter substrate-binding protein [Caldisericia bacterium]